MLSVRDVSLIHLGPVQLQVGAGQSCSISGRSGSGKSLLLRALADLDPHDGEIILDGVNQTAVPGPVWRRQIGYLGPASVFWENTVQQHFAAFDQPLLLAHLNSLGLDEKILPRPVNQLSSGEKQRLSLIRLLLDHPKALLLDEPCSHLDPETTRQAEALISDYQQRHHCPILWVSHDPAQRKRVASRHYFLAHGQLQVCRTRA